MSGVVSNKEHSEKTLDDELLHVKSAYDAHEVHHKKTSPLYSLLGRKDVVLIPVDDHKEIDQAELLGFRRTVAEMQWLLVVLVILCMKLPGMVVLNPESLLITLGLFSAFICFVHYIWRSHGDKRWKLALNTWAMIFFITAVVWQTGALTSPLLPLYFLVVILSATTLGMLTTMMETALITACYALLAASGSGSLQKGLDTFNPANLPGPVVQLFLLWFVAYFVSLIAWESERAKGKIRQLSRTDQLTGLWNMQMLLIFMQREHLRSKRMKRSFAVMIIDADDLKMVNDTYGHDAGTMLIVHIAETMRSRLRGSDMLARFGGDEFVALLPETDSDGALKVAEDMRREIADSAIDYEGNSINIQVSIGIACFPRHGKAVAQLIKNADKALYWSKHHGKNQSKVYHLQEQTEWQTATPAGRKKEKVIQSSSGKTPVKQV